MKGRMLLMFIGSMAAAAAVDRDPLFSAKIVSVAREGRKYSLAVSLESISPGYAPLHVKAPDQWGHTTFATKGAGEAVVASTNASNYSEGGYRGIVFHKGDKFTFSFEGEVTDDGSIMFTKLDEKLDIFSTDTEIRVAFHLYVSDFKSGKCHLEIVETAWSKLEYPFPIHPADSAKGPAKAPEVPAPPQLPK